MHTPEELDAAAGQIVSVLNSTDEEEKKQAVVVGIGVLNTFVKAQVRQAIAAERAAVALEQIALTLDMIDTRQRGG